MKRNSCHLLIFTGSLLGSACGDPCLDDGLSLTKCNQAASGSTDSAGTQTDSATDSSAATTDTGPSGSGSTTTGVSATGSTTGVTDSSTSATNGSGTTTTGLPTWCKDSDMDGFGDPSDCMDAAEQPDGYVDDDGDCDDQSAETFPGAAPLDHPNACMKDVDGDDYGDEAPPAGVTPGTDCDDTEPFAYPGAAENESNKECMKDSDEDGFGDANPPGDVFPGIDCDDGNILVQTCMTWCADMDQDGYGDPNDCVMAPMPPQGHVGNMTDCDDSNPDIYPGAAPKDDPLACMKDSDDDNWGDANPPMTAVPGTDCNDADAMLAANCLSVVVTATPQNILLGEASDLLAVAMDGDGNYGYTWFPAATLTDPLIDSPVAMPAQTTLYNVDAVDGTNAMASGSVVVHVTDVAVDLQNCGGLADFGVDIANPSPAWMFSPDGTRACQTQNSDPTAWLCAMPMSDVTIRSSFRVETTNDDDMIGFVWGHEDDSHFYLFTWKEVAQGFADCNNVIAERGMTIKKFDTPGALDCADFLETADTGNTVVLANPANFYDQGYQDNVEYIFELVHTPTDFTVTVTRAADMVQIAQTTIPDASYPVGRFGIYAYSQEDSCFFDVFTQAN